MPVETTPVRRVADSLSHPVVVTGLVLVLLHLGFRAWALSTSWFYTDDYALMRTAGESTLSWSYLMLPENGHVMPATRALFYAFAHGPGLDWGAASAVTLLLQLGAAASALWALVTLFGPRWGVIPLLTLYLSTAMTAQATLWWVSSINQTPVLMTFFLAVGAWVRYLRSGRWLPLLGTLAAVCWGLLFFQKALLVLPLLAVIALSYFASGGVIARVTQTVRGYWRSAVVLGGTAAAFTVYFAVRVPTTGGGEGGVAWVDLVTGLVGRAFVPGVVGGPIHWESRPGGSWADAPPWFLALAWVVVLGVVGASLVLRRRAGRAWLLILVHFVILIGTIGVSRATVFGAEIGTAYRLQTEGIVVVVIALGLAWLPLLGAVETSEPRTHAWAPSWRPALLVAPMTVIVSVVGSVSWLGYIDDWAEENDSEPFATTVFAQSQRLPGLELADREVPESILTDLSRPNNRLSDIADVLAPSARFPDSSLRLSVVADGGTIHQALIEPVARSRSGPVPECGWVIEPGRSTVVPMEVPSPFQQQWMRIPYFAADDGTVSVSADGAAVTLPVRSGPNSIYLKVPEAIDGVRFTDLTTRGALCVDIIEVGLPVPGPRL